MSKSSESKSKKSDKKKADKKPKRVTGQNVGPQGFLPEHGEKLGFGLFGLVVLLCAWGALGHDSYQKTPAELASVLQQRRNAVQQNKPEGSPLLTSLEVRDFSKQAPDSVVEVAVVERIAVPGVRNPEIHVILKRGEPELYPAEDGRTFAMYGPFVWEKPESKKPVGGKAAPGKAAAGGPKAKEKEKDPFAGLMPAADPKKAKKSKEKAAPAVPVGGPPAMAPIAAAPVKGVHVPPTTEYRGLEFVMVTFRVPRVKQAEAFRRVFENARDYRPDRDTSNYVSFWIQRKTDNGDWEEAVTIERPSGKKTVSFLEAFWETQKHFPLSFPEIVDTAQENCVIPINDKVLGPDGKETLGGFTANLPPMLGDDFDERAAGDFPMKQVGAAPGFSTGPGVMSPGGPGASPGGPGAMPGMTPGGPGPGRAGPPGGFGQPGDAIKRAPGQRRGKGPGGGKMGPGGATPSGYGGSSSSQSGGGGMGPGGAMPKGYGGSSGGQSGGGGMGPGGATPSGYGSSGGQYGGGVSNPFGPKTKQNQGAGVVANQVQVAQLSDILLRFFDFTVEEGHTYQYQVMVVLQNPNHKLLPGVLKDPNLAKEEFLRTAYSKPTEPVRVTIGGSEVIAGPVKPAKIEGGVADSATAILRQRDRSSGALVAHTFQKLEAGQVLNMPVKEFKEIKFEKPVGGVDALQQFTFQSDNLVLDLRGTGDKGWPGEMLLLDSGGRLVLGSEVGKSNPNFAAESARLESVYNQQQPTSPTEAGSGLSGFGSIGSPLGLPAPTPAGKKKPK